MEVAQLCKSAYNNQLQQFIYLCHKRKMSHHDAHLHPLTNVPTKCQPSTPYGIQEINPDKILKLMANMTRSKVKSRSHHDVAHLQPLTNVRTKYQLPTPYGFQDIARTKFYRSRSLQQGQRSNQGHTMTLTPTTPNQCPY